jgi:hypothetical protein
VRREVGSLGGWSPGATLGGRPGPKGRRDGVIKFALPCRSFFSANLVGRDPLNTN